MLIKVHDDDDSLDVVRIHDESTCNSRDGDKQPVKTEKERYQNPTEDVDLVLIYLLERGN